MHSLHRVPLAVAILAAALTSAPAFAQSRPDLLEESQLNASVLVRVPAWQQVQERDVDDGSRRATFVERLGFAAIVTAVGAGVGYGWWHDCNDPEADFMWSCIVAPRRLETSVRGGAYTGLVVGLAGALGNLRAGKRHSLVRAAGPSVLIDHSARSGFRVGVNFRF